jgi:glycosyltransferase involved in cell wall biosynthesis
MRFSVDAHAIGRHLTGNEVYVRNLLHGFAVLDDESEFIAYLSERDATRQIPERFQCRSVASNPFRRLGYDLSSRVKQDRPDLLHVQYTAPLGCSAPIVVSVHDVSYLERPDFFPWTRSTQLKITVRQTVRRAAKVLTPSEFSKQGILKAYDLPDEQVEVVPNAVSSDFRPRSRPRAAEEIRNTYGIPSPYILTVGDLQPRKNQVGLIRAYEELIRFYPDLPHHLVMIGKEGWYGSRVRRAAQKSGLAERIHFPGFVSDEELTRFYAGCELFVFPSFYEGFGLPILEAMASGRAVACSNTTAIPEVADACAILFDPSSVEEMTLAMRDLLLDDELRARVERLGLKRAGLYSWRNTARKTLDAYYAVAGRKQPAESYRVKSVPVS